MTAVSHTDNQPPLDDQTQSLGTRTSTGAMWMGLGRMLDQILRVVVGAVLARLLTPDEFGIVAMAMVFSGFLSVFADAGLRSAVVQFRDMDERGLSSAFWLSVLLGLFCVGSLATASPYIDRFGGMKHLGIVAAVLGIGLLFTAAGMVPCGVLQRRMRFRDTALCEGAAGIIAGIVAVVMAYRGASYWAVVAQSLVASGLATVFYFGAARWRPRWTFEPGIARKLAGFSGNLTWFNVLNYWARNLDSLLVGWLFGSAQLGYYNRAYALMLYPLTMLHSAITPVLHPALSELQNDVKRMYDVYLRVMKLVAVISIPMTVALGLMAKAVVRTLWGTQWDASIPLFQVLCVVAAVQPIVAASGSVYLARNRPDLYSRIGTLYVIIVCAGIVAGTHWGVMGVAVGYSIAYTVGIIPIMYVIVVRLLNGRLWDMARLMRLPLVLAGAVAGVIIGLNALVAGRLQAPVHLLIGGSLSAALVCVLTYVLDKRFVLETCSLAPAALRSRIPRFLKE